MLITIVLLHSTNPGVVNMVYGKQRYFPLLLVPFHLCTDDFQASHRRRLANMYIRVKRNKTTYFIQCEPTETALSIKQKLHSLIDQPPINQQLLLWPSSDVLEDSKTLADQKVPIYLAVSVHILLK